MDTTWRGELRTYKLCTCPTCRNRYILKLHIEGLKNSTDKTEKDKVEHILEKVTVKTLSCDGGLEEGIQGSLKTVIKDEKLYVEVMQRVHEVFEARI